MNPTRLRRLFSSLHTCVRIVTAEEADALRLVLDCAGDMKLEPYTWSVTSGIRPARMLDSPAYTGTENPGAALCWWRANIAAPSMCIALDMADHFEDKRVLRMWRELVDHFRSSAELSGRAFVAMIDHSDATSLAVSANSTRYFIAPPVDDEIEEILKRSLAKINRRSSITIDVSRSQLAAIVGNLRGLSRWQIEQAVAATVADDRTFNADDLMTVIRAKRQILQAAGVLEFVDTPASMDEIGGLSKLKKWLHQRKDAMREDAREMGLSPPRGVMLLGVQGAGKSLAAKAIAAAWKRPLMKLDPSVLYDRYIGESERRLREALAQAEAMSPVILWIDEIEKGFAGAASTSNDGGLSRRMFGTLLNWMQEHSSPVFLVATANDIEALPPELLRKGRFDEIFFVDLPGDEARRKILAIHLKKRKQDPAAFDLAQLAEQCEGYSGAEIEQAVIIALHGVYAGRARQPAASLTTERLLEAILASPPLSVTMAEKINALREWARGRCVPAD